MKARFVPIAIFVALFVALIWRLENPADTNIHSQLVNRPVPPITLTALREGQPPLTQAALSTGKPQLLNFFASWCIPCIGEAPHLMRLKAEGVPIVGIAVRDTPQATEAFLAEHGDPFRAIGLDKSSAGQLALGSSGVPETFVVDGKGVIRRQFIGGIDEKSLPQIRQALAEAAQ